MKPISNKYYISIRDKRTLKKVYSEVPGERILKKKYPDIDLFIHHSITWGNKNSKLWMVSEGKTGCKLLYIAQYTKKRATEEAEKVVEKIGVEEFIKRIKELLSERSISPRYKGGE